MALPDYQSLMLPILCFASEQPGEVTGAAATEAIAVKLNLSEEDLRHMLPSGTQSTITNRVSWAVVYMKKAGLLESTRRGYFRITEEAQDFVTGIGSKIVLIDGEQLAQLMIDHDVGVSTAATYHVKRLDSDYFNAGA